MMTTRTTTKTKKKPQAREPNGLAQHSRPWKGRERPNEWARERNLWKIDTMMIWWRLSGSFFPFAHFPGPIGCPDIQITGTLPEEQLCDWKPWSLDDCEEARNLIGGGGFFHGYAISRLPRPPPSFLRFQSSGAPFPTLIHNSWELAQGTVSHAN